MIGPGAREAEGSLENPQAVHGGLRERVRSSERSKRRDGCRIFSIEEIGAHGKDRFRLLESEDACEG